MSNTPCPECGLPVDADAKACANCGHALRNGTAHRTAGPVQKARHPSELAGRAFEQVPPEVIEKALGSFDLEELMADVREIEETGGVKFEDFIGEIEEIVNRRD